MCFNGFWSEDDPLLLKHVAAVNTAVQHSGVDGILVSYFTKVNNITIIQCLLNSISVWSRVILQKPTITQSDFLKYLEDGRSEVI